MADYHTMFSVLLPIGAGNVGAALALYDALADELDDKGETVGFLADANAPEGDGTVWLHDDAGHGDPEHVITYALRCAEAFSLTGTWGFHYALSCSRPRLDGFGGGAQVLDLGGRKSLGWLDTGHWLDGQLQDAALPATSAEAVLRPVTEAQGWNDHTRAAVLLGFLDTLIADDRGVTERLRAHLAAAASAADEDFTCRECGAETFVSDAGTTHHVGRGMDGIDHNRDRNHTALPEREPS